MSATGITNRIGFIAVIIFILVVDGRTIMSGLA